VLAEEEAGMLAGLEVHEVGDADRPGRAELAGGRAGELLAAEAALPRAVEPSLGIAFEVQSIGGFYRYSWSRSRKLKARGE
jgi:hypothetical protein